MFTGIVQEIGIVNYIRSGTISLSSTFRGVKTGDSIMVNGVCLTVTVYKENGEIIMNAGTETIRITSLSKLKSGSKVNLERALRLSDRIDGHLVYGHVMETGSIISITTKNNTKHISISASKDFLKKIFLKGSIAVDGVSLTINSINKTAFSVAVVPETIKRTTLGSLSASAKVNLEADMLLLAASGGNK